MTDVQPQPRVEALAAAIRDELIQLWGELDYACRTAYNGAWSIQCENLAERIVTLSRLVGPTPWGEVAVETLQSGVYERVHREAGIEAPAIDWERVQHVANYLRRGGTLSAPVPAEPAPPEGQDTPGASRAAEAPGGRRF